MRTWGDSTKARPVLVPDGTETMRAIRPNGLVGQVKTSDFLQYVAGAGAPELAFATRTAFAAATISAVITHVRTAGYATVGDGGGALYVRTTAGAANSYRFQSADSAWWVLAPDESKSVYALQFGVTADGATNDTAALQEFVDYLTAYASTNNNGRALRGYLPAGIIRTSGVTITRAMHIQGAGSNATRLTQIAGLDTSFISVRIAFDTTNYYAVGNPPPTVIFQGIRLVGQGWSTGFSNNHGLVLQNAAVNPITTEVILRDVRVQDFPGNNIYGLAFTGWVEGYEVSSGFAGLDALSCTSCADWNFVAPQLYISRHGVLLSGCINFHFLQYNVWSNREHGVYLYAGSLENSTMAATFVSGSIDRNTKNAVFCDMRAGTEAGARFAASMIHLSSDGGDNVSSEVLFSVSATQSLSFIACSFSTVTSQSASATYKAKHHFEFAGTSARAIVDAATTYTVALSTNQPTSIVSPFPGSGSFVGGLTIGTGAASSEVILNGAVATTRKASFRTASSQRFEFGVSATAESGSDAGSDLYVNRHSDAGAYLGTPFFINRATGRTTIALLSVVLTNFADDAAAAAGGVPLLGLYRNGSVVQVRVT